MLCIARYDAVSEGARPSTIGMPDAVADLCHAMWAFFPGARPTAAEVAARLKHLKSVAEWDVVRHRGISRLSVSHQEDEHDERDTSSHATSEL